MIFTNNSEKIKNVYIESIIKRIFLLVSSFIIVLIPLWLLLHDAQYRTSVILTTVIFGSISGLLGILFSLKIIKQYYLAYQISIVEDDILVKTNKKEKKIDNNKIKKITKNKKGEIFLYYNKYNKEKISQYINDRDELITILNNKKSIEIEKNYEYIIFTLPFVFFGLYQLVRVFPNKYYYLITGIGFIITTTIYLIKSSLTNYKKISLYFNIIVYGFLIFLVSKTMLKLIVSFKYYT